MISKYILTGQDYQELREELYTWLKKNAEGHVFDSVEMGTTFIECKKDGKSMVNIMPATSSSTLFTLTLANGVKSTANFGGSAESGYAIKTNSGIFLYLKRGSTYYNLFVTRDGAMAGFWSTSASPSGATYMSAFFNDVSFIDYGKSPSFSTALTSFVPLCGNGNFTTSTDLYCTLHSAHSGERCILFDGERRYVYSGFFALKE